MRIYKYSLAFTGPQTLEIPGDILSVSEQNNEVVVYAMVYDEAEPTEYTFYIYGTGHPIPEIITHAEFLGTVKMANGALMLHVFFSAPPGTERRFRK